MLEPRLQQPGERRHAHRLLESPAEMCGRDPGDFCQVFQSDIFVQVVFHRLTGATDLPAGEATDRAGCDGIETMMAAQQVRAGQNGPRLQFELA